MIYNLHENHESLFHHYAPGDGQAGRTAGQERESDHERADARGLAPLPAAADRFGRARIHWADRPSPAGLAGHTPRSQEEGQPQTDDETDRWGSGGGSPPAG